MRDGGFCFCFCFSLAREANAPLFRLIPCQPLATSNRCRSQCLNRAPNVRGMSVLSVLSVFSVAGSLFVGYTGSTSCYILKAARYSPSAAFSPSHQTDSQGVAHAPRYRSPPCSCDRNYPFLCPHRCRLRLSVIRKSGLYPALPCFTQLYLLSPHQSRPQLPEISEISEISEFLPRHCQPRLGSRPFQHRAKSLERVHAQQRKPFFC